MATAVPQSRNSMKLLGDLSISKTEKKSNKVRFSVCVQSKVIDGKPVVSYKLEHENWDYPVTKQSKEQEYTSSAEFVQIVNKAIEKAAQELS